MVGYRPSEGEIDAYGSMLAATYFSGTLIGGALMTVQWLMVVWGLFIFTGTSKDIRQGRLYFVLISYLILLTSSAGTCIDIWMNYRVLYNGGPTGKSYLRANATNFTMNKTSNLISDALIAVAIASGDILMLWRCLVLWRDKVWAVVPPSLACIGAVACNIIYLFWVFSDTPSVSNAEHANKALVASISLGVAGNIMITLLILLRLALTWLHNRQAFPERKAPRLYSSVAATLIESAAPLAVFGICLVVAAGIRTSPNKSFSLAQQGRINAFYEVSSWLYYGFCALSPQMIIFRVTTGKLWKNGSEGTSDVAPLSQPIRFAGSVVDSRIPESRDGV
ncbi:hypothetical protein BKA70DRAFT_1509471 [Coprinopsis sp. MPI-PUGE-AT-0042]|nr:hypothetical protein BKA70DRAFT_1509471 [Coprinopsis sp. MPI-PUGE-AT-0042]